MIYVPLALSTIICDIGRVCTIDLSTYTIASCSSGVFPTMTISLTGPSTVLTDASSTFVNNIYASPQALTFDFTGDNYMYMQTYTFNTLAFFQITGDALSYSSNSDSFYIKVEDYCEREAVITDPLISTQNTYFVS